MTEKNVENYGNLPNSETSSLCNQWIAILAKGSCTLKQTLKESDQGLSRCLG